mgnify:CR=1 FL=1|tara:strand:+ start:79439 stop:81034 length:1596 start_codon:yes stop_codon:yes gene_type:complete
MNLIKNNLQTIAFFFIVVFLYSLDLGNVNGLRQGTEGFYLLISKNMSETYDLLTPYIYGERHWSKPPLHFWLPLPFSLFLDSFLLAARVSVLYFSIAMTLFITTLLPKNYIHSKLTFFLFLFSTVGFLKYTRIYMMEMPLLLLSTVGALGFYQISKFQSHYKTFTLFVFLMASSMLIKGPVSFVMVFSGALLYSIVKGWSFFKSIFMRSFGYFTLSLLVGSIWFFISYYNYGEEFFNYFFLRENAGKFSAQPYPLRRVFQGLIIFSLPWSLLFFFPKKLFSFIKESLNDDFFKFCLCNFFAFFVLWLIPNQRSHHYAMPSLIFFLLILYPFFHKFFSEISTKLLKSYHFLFLFLITLVTFLSAYVFGFTFLYENFWSFLFIIFSVVLYFVFYKKQTKNIMLLKNILLISIVWCVLIPIFYLPIVPGSTIDLLQDKKIGVNYRKPFFIEEQINKEVTILNDNNTMQFLDGTNLIILPYFKLNIIKGARSVRVVSRWKIWKRGLKVSDIYKSVSLNRQEDLYTAMVLVELKQD